MKMTVLAALICAAAMVSGCGRDTEAKPEAQSTDIRPVRVLKVDAAAAARAIEFAGEVRPRYETRLAFRVGGKMTERLVEVGTTVRAGQPVARIDPRDLELAAASAKTQIVQLEAERKFAEGDLRRYRELREKNFISQAELDRRVSTYDSTEARLEVLFPTLARGQGVGLLMASYALMIGLWQISDPPACLASAMERPEMRMFKVDLEKQLGAVLVNLWEGATMRRDGSGT